MKIVSLCAGVGVSDKCFTLYGGDVIVASDLDSKSLMVYKENHPDTQAVHGSLCAEQTQTIIIKAAQDKLKDEPLDLLTLFLPPGRESIEIITATKKIAETLNAKCIYIDALTKGQYKSLKKFNGIQSFVSGNLENYHLLSVSHKLSDYGVPAGNKREPYFLLNKSFFNDTHIAEARNYINNLPKTLCPTVEEVLQPISAIHPESMNENPAPKISQLDFLDGEQVTPSKVKATDSTDLLQLHRTVYAFNDGLPRDALKAKIDNMKQGEKLFKPGLSKTMDGYIRSGCSAQRVDANSALKGTVSARAKQGFFWKIHPAEARGFTPLELLFIMTMDKIPFELSYQDGNWQGAVIQKIAGATPPVYLLRLIGHTIIPILKLQNANLSLIQTNNSTYSDQQKKFSAMTDFDNYYYLGSNHIIRSTASITAKQIYPIPNNIQEPSNTPAKVQLPKLDKKYVTKNRSLIDESMLEKFTIFHLPLKRGREEEHQSSPNNKKQKLETLESSFR